MATLLNIERLTAKLQEKGLRQSAVAEHLQVSREAVSKWFRSESVPTPDKLLRLGLLLGIGVADLLVRDDSQTPVIAFRKKAGAKTTVAHEERARRMGMLLRALGPFLDQGPFAPTEIMDPSLEYAGLQDVTKRVRESIKLSQTEKISPEHLVGLFRDNRAVLVPVLWGQKGAHENALHIYLPDSRTTWIYLNLDVQAHDFMFWMAHELGHVLSPSLRGDKAEDFADAFAGALLVPNDTASHLYERVMSFASGGMRIKCIKEIAEDLSVSPYCIYKQLNAYAFSEDLEPLQLEPAIHGASRNLNNQYRLVSEAVLGTAPTAENLIEFAEVHLHSPFFRALRAYLHASPSGLGFIQAVMNISATDAADFYRTLSVSEAGKRAPN